MPKLQTKETFRSITDGLDDELENSSSEMMRFFEIWAASSSQFCIILSYLLQLRGSVKAETRPTHRFCSQTLLKKKWKQPKGQQEFDGWHCHVNIHHLIWRSVDNPIRCFNWWFLNSLVQLHNLSTLLVKLLHFFLFI